MSIGNLLRKTEDYITSEREELKDLESIINVPLKNRKHRLSSNIVIPEGRYHARNHLFVAPEGFLEIRPGAEIYFDAGKSLFVRGAIKAMGEKDDPIKITGYFDQKFGSITLLSAHADSEFRNCDISNAVGETVSDMAAISEVDIRCFRQDGIYTKKGAFLIICCSPTIESCFFHDIKERDISPLFIADKSSPRILFTRFEKNTCKDGGAISNESFDFPVIKGCYFANNMVGRYGGAIQNRGYGLLEGCVIERCYSAGEGGAIMFSYPKDHDVPEYGKCKNVRIVESLIAFNHARIIAGGMLLKNSVLRVREGIVDYNGPAVPDFEDMMDKPLSPEFGDEAYDIQKDGFTVYRTKIIANLSTRGAGICADDKDITMERSHVLYNLADEGDDGVQIESGRLSLSKVRTHRENYNFAGAFRW